MTAPVVASAMSLPAIALPKKNHDRQSQTAQHQSPVLDLPAHASQGFYHRVAQTQAAEAGTEQVGHIIKDVLPRVESPANFVASNDAKKPHPYYRQITRRCVCCHSWVSTLAADKPTFSAKPFFS